MNISKGWKRALGVLGIVVLAVVALFVIIKPPSQPPCGDNMEFFSHSLIDIENIDSIMPLGTLAPSGHTFPVKHLYYNLDGYGYEGDVQVSGDPYTVYAPGDMVLTGISSSEYPEEGYTDYSINFSVCKELTGYFLHLTALSGELEEKLDSPFKFCKTSSPGGREMIDCSYLLANIEVSAGDLIGEVGRPGQVNFDFGARDTRVDKPETANPERVQNRDETAVCALDYYTQPLKDQLYGLLGSGENFRRTIVPRCGTPYQDLVGTLQGVWYAKEGKSDKRDERLHLTLSYDNVDPTIGVISMGKSLESLGVSEGVYEFIPVNSGSINREFSEVTDGRYCYDADASGDPANLQYSSIVIEMVDEENIKVGPAKTSPCTLSSSFDGFVEFVR